MLKSKKSLPLLLVFLLQFSSLSQSQGAPVVKRKAAPTPASVSPTAKPSAAPSIAGTPNAESLADRMTRVDQLLLQRFDPEKRHEATDALRKLNQELPLDRDIGWKFAMATYSYGFNLKNAAKGEKAKLFEEGRDAALRVAEKFPDCAPCHFWTAINHALLGSEKGVFSSASGLKKVREHAYRVLELDATYAQGGAHRLLAQIDKALPGILGGSNSRARKHFEAAIQIAPDEPMNYYELSQLLANEFDDPQAALDIAKKGLAIGPLPADRVEGNETLDHLKIWILKLNEKIAQKK